MFYLSPQTISTNNWNNKFAFQERMKAFWKAEIIVPQMIQWTTQDLGIWQTITFNEYENWSIKQFHWLKNLIQIKWSNTYIIDNHNHALYYRYKSYLENNFNKWLTLIHIDQHSDMAEANSEIDINKEEDLNYIAQYTNKVCNVWNFIIPAIHSWLIKEIIQIRTEESLLNFDLEKLLNTLTTPNKKSNQSLRTKWSNLNQKTIYQPSAFILDIDLDFRDPKMWIQQTHQTIKKVQELIQSASITTIATSPYFIDQNLAISLAKQILN